MVGLGPGRHRSDSEATVAEDVGDVSPELRRVVTDLVAAEVQRVAPDQRIGPSGQRSLRLAAVALMIMTTAASVLILEHVRPAVGASVTMPADVAGASTFAFGGGGGSSATLFTQAQAVFAVGAADDSGAGPGQTLYVRLPVRAGACARLAVKAHGTCGEPSTRGESSTSALQSVTLTTPALLEASAGRARSLTVSTGPHLALQSSGARAVIQVSVTCLTAPTVAELSEVQAGVSVGLDCACASGRSEGCEWLTLASQFGGQAPTDIDGWTNLALSARARDASIILTPGPWFNTVALSVDDAVSDLVEPAPQQSGTKLLLGARGVTQFRLDSASPARGVVLGTSRATDARVDESGNLVKSEFHRLGGYGSSYFLTVVGILGPIMLALSGQAVGEAYRGRRSRKTTRR